MQWARRAELSEHPPERGAEPHSAPVECIVPGRNSPGAGERCGAGEIEQPTAGKFHLAVRGGSAGRSDWKIRQI